MLGAAWGEEQIGVQKADSIELICVESNCKKLMLKANTQLIHFLKRMSKWAEHEIFVFLSEKISIGIFLYSREIDACVKIPGRTTFETFD